MIDLVTGGAGFIGSHLVRQLVSSGRSVRVVDDLSSGRMERLEDVRSRIDFVKADLTVADLDPIVRGVTRVFHLAAVPSVTRSVLEPVRTHDAAATATLRLLVAGREAGIERFVNSSSSSVYGETTVSPKREDLRPEPISPYGVAKLAAEGYVRAFARLHGIRTVSLRYFNVFGPGQDPASQYAAVIPRFITQALAGTTLLVHGDGDQTRDFTYVENVVAANVRAASATCEPGSVYNIAAGDARSVNDLIRALGAAVGRELSVSHGPARPGDIRHSHADVSRAASELEWRPTVGFEEGLRRTLEWYRSAL